MRMRYLATWATALILCAGLPLSQTALAVTLPAQNSAGTEDNALLQRLSHAHWVAQGSGPRVLYMIFDPDCVSCHVVFDELQPLIKAMDVTVRYVPVGYFTQSSPGKAAAILEAKDPLAAIMKNEREFNKERFGGLNEVLPSPATEKALEENLAILRATELVATPTLIYRSRQGKVVILRGRLGKGDMRSMLRDIAS
ncbi:thioredoxin fold domain-containing protein [Acidithiobacillus sp.]